MATTLAAAALVAAGTQASLDVAASAREHRAWVQWWTNGEPLSDDIEVGDTVDPGDVETLVDAAIAEGTNAVATVESSVTPTITTSTGSPIVGIYPTQDWDTVLVAGDAPQAGEVVVSASVAETVGVALGDVVDLVDAWDADRAATGVKVSGLSAAAASGAFVTYPPTGYGNWNDVLEWDAATGEVTVEGANGATTLASAVVSWSGESATLAPLLTEEASVAPVLASEVFRVPLGGWSGALWLASLVVGVAALAAGFAIGRSQAQARVEWVATARVLGARRGALLAASALEAVALGVTASALGLFLGWLAVAGVLAAQSAAQPLATLPATPTLLPVAAALVCALGLTLAALTALVPAFWASRVPPSAALKPVTPLAEQSVSRSVSPRWLAVLTGAAAGLAITGRLLEGTTMNDAALVIEWVGVVALAVLVVPVLLEASRRTLPRLARYDERSGEPWAIAAADAIRSRTRQLALAAMVTGLTMGVAAGGLAATRLGARQEDDPSWLSAVAIVLAAGALSTLVAAAVVMTARAAGRHDEGVREALGLSPADARRAAAAELRLPVLAGATLGIGLAWVAVATTWTLVAATEETIGASSWASGLLTASAVCAGCWLVAACFAGGGGALVGLATPAHADGERVLARQ
ncbi:FtsX-like permease family protein [Demequina sp. NBRC 110057]|uniref:FtsX-like permease family protein n=1 Tax=Demequina sp. NBRC 110057 TaxID=1570346 RepID=UPI0013564589|nr:FtsX-like permease family protein [Demequina sp. NBRC 110057]